MSGLETDFWKQGRYHDAAGGLWNHAEDITYRKSQDGAVCHYPYGCLAVWIFHADLFICAEADSGFAL